MVTGWGQIRNEAAHALNQFNRTPEQVKLMISAVRDFIARVR